MTASHDTLVCGEAACLVCDRHTCPEKTQEGCIQREHRWGKAGLATSLLAWLEIDWCSSCNLLHHCWLHHARHASPAHPANHSFLMRSMDRWALLAGLEIEWCSSCNLAASCTPRILSSSCQPIVPHEMHERLSRAGCHPAHKSGLLYWWTVLIHGKTSRSALAWSMQMSTTPIRRVLPRPVSIWQWPCGFK